MGEIELANLDALEKKINKAAELINKLRQEKIALEQENKELKEKINSLYINKEELLKEMEILKVERERNQDSNNAREEIKGKVEEMLAKLDELDI